MQTVPEPRHRKRPDQHVQPLAVTARPTNQAVQPHPQFRAQTLVSVHLAPLAPSRGEPAAEGCTPRSGRSCISPPSAVAGTASETSPSLPIQPRSPLEAIPAGSRTQLVWKRDVPRRLGVEFIEQGGEWVDSGEFQETCSDFISQVIGRLAHFGIEDTFLQREWDAIQSADEDEAKFCETAAGIGWGPIRAGRHEPRPRHRDLRPTGRPAR